MTLPAKSRSHAPLTRFCDGLIISMPLVASTVVFGLVYRVLARQVGLSLGARILMSVLVFSGAVQFTVVSLWGHASGPLILAGSPAKRGCDEAWCPRG